MTFDEYDKELMELVDRYGDEPYYGDIDNLVDKLQETYAPTVEMTKNDKDILLYNLENYSFDVFIESIALSDKEKFGLPANKEFEGLSIEQLMRAWLNPETIEVVE